MYLLLGDPHVVLHVSKHSRLDEKAFVSELHAACTQLCTFFLPTVYQVHDLVELILVDLGLNKRQNDVAKSIS